MEWMSLRRAKFNEMTTRTLYNARCSFAGAVMFSGRSVIVVEGDGMFDNNFAGVNGGEKRLDV